METGEPVTGIEVAGQRANQIGERLWMTYWHPLRGADGEIVGVNVAAEEITERKHAEAALQASEREFRTLADSIPQLIWMAEASGKIFWFNSHWYDYADVHGGETVQPEWQAIVDPAVGGKARRQWAQSLKAGTALEIELPLRGKDGQYRPFLTRAIPLCDADSTVYRWIGTHIDISEQKRREEHIRFIIDELSHRTKNLLKPFRESKGGRISATGPPIILKPDAVQNLGLALHELATNALKYGALSIPHGKVSIQWHLNETADRVCMHWRERDGPPVVLPHRRGFGYVVIEQIVPAEIARSIFLPPE